MPVTAIPFRSPASFELPEHVLEALRGLLPAAAAEQALELLDQLDAADMSAICFLEGDRLAPGPVLARDDESRQAMNAGLAQMVDKGETPDFMRAAIAQQAPLLLMGELGAQDGAPFPPALADLLRQREDRGSVGFFYVLPLLDAAGVAHGAMALHRRLAAGPLNHDQPAIAQALATELARLIATPSAAS